MGKHMADMQMEVNEAVAFYIDLASELYGMDFEVPRVRYDIRGTTAGQARAYQWAVRFNPVLLQENFEDMIEQTVPHEVAHLVARKKTPYRIKPHGHEWKQIMRDFGKSATRCHDYDTSNARAWRRNVSRSSVMAPSRPRERFPYECSCCHKKVSVGPTQNRRWHQGTIYVSKCCRAKIKPIEG